MSKLRKILTDYRTIVVMVAIVFSLLAIAPNPFTEGVAIRHIVKDSAAYNAGIPSPSPQSTPTSRERIISISNVKITDVASYYDYVNSLPANKTIQVKTSRSTYRLITKQAYNVTFNGTELQTVQELVPENITINGSLATIYHSVNKTVAVNKTIMVPIGTEDLGINVYPAPTNNIRKGLDLQGGTRVLLQPEEKLSITDMDYLISIMTARLNAFGLSDLTIRQANDLSGNQYILVEIAGVNEEEVRELISKQGKFEAKIGPSTVFKGGDDITYVCRSADCSGIDPDAGCSVDQGKWYCRFRFSISLSPDAAARQAALTSNLAIIPSGTTSYLNQSLDLFLDDKQVDTLNIGSDLKGRAITDIQISGSGTGNNQREATTDALLNMKKLQTVLITGSLPVKLDIIRTDSISPVLGSEFLKNAFIMGFFAILAVVIVLFISYRSPMIALPIMFTCLVEIFMLFGMASLIGWNIDLAAIAGVIVAVGTGVNDQIVITDEVLHGESRRSFTWKEKLKNAFFIIFGAYFTLLVAMLPLLVMGAGLLKGFALTTILGVSAGVFITRPAYARIIEILLKEE